MGPGEDYWYKFVRWYLALAEDAQAAYRATHPEPDDWREFYAFLSLPETDREVRRTWSERRTAARRAFLEAEYQKGLASEEMGRTDDAIAHYTIVIRRDGSFRDALERLKRLDPESFVDGEPDTAADRPRD